MKVEFESEVVTVVSSSSRSTDEGTISVLDSRWSSMISFGSVADKFMVRSALSWFGFLIRECVISAALSRTVCSVLGVEFEACWMLVSVGWIEVSFLCSRSTGSEK